MRSSCDATHESYREQAAAVWRLLSDRLARKDGGNTPYGTGTAPQYDSRIPASADTIHFPHTGDIVYYDGSSTTVLPAATYACLQTWCPLRAIKPTNKRSKFSTGRSHPILASLS